MRNKVKRLSNSSKRNDQLEAGLFDGRFRQRVVVDKKKKQSRNWARKNK
jgi:stalled ribosome alternative rescue factor ArfA